MGFFASGGTKKQIKDKEEEIKSELWSKMECKACPLNTVTNLHNPKMEATGSDKPVIYCIGEAPGTNEDLEGEQFVGKSGDLLRPLLRTEIRKKKVRWNNTIRCHPSKNRDLEKIEIECCRPSIVRDIENTKPKVIFGFGGIPLAWAINRTGIT
ncbi:MAG TPA: uracil-DNA glycosylase family protein, partial [Candidatus Nitrosotalea sp.]|nr:uracil-DNA glycosylase family protein [Candidatus Nitrosotalea sp.]